MSGSTSMFNSSARLAQQTLLEGFADFDFSAGELPAAAETIVPAAAANQHVPLAANHRECDVNSFHKFCPKLAKV